MAKADQIKKFKILIQETVPFIYPQPIQLGVKIEDIIPRHNTPSLRALDYLKYIVSNSIYEPPALSGRFDYDGSECINSMEIIKDEFYHANSEEIKNIESLVYAKTMQKTSTNTKKEVVLRENTEIELVDKDTIDSQIKRLRRKNSKEDCIPNNIEKKEPSLGNSPGMVLENLEIILLGNSGESILKFKAAVEKTHLEQNFVVKCINDLVTRQPTCDLLFMEIYFIFLEKFDIKSEIPYFGMLLDLLEHKIIGQEIKFDLMNLVINNFGRILSKDKNIRVCNILSLLLKSNYCVDINLVIKAFNILLENSNPLELMNDLLTEYPNITDLKATKQISLNDFVIIRCHSHAIINDGIFVEPNYISITNMLFNSPVSNSIMENILGNILRCSNSRVVVISYLVYFINKYKNTKYKLTDFIIKTMCKYLTIIDQIEEEYKIPEESKNISLNETTSEEIIYSAILNMKNTLQSLTFVYKVTISFLLKLLSKGGYSSKIIRHFSKLKFRNLDQAEKCKAVEIIRGFRYTGKLEYIAVILYNLGSNAFDLYLKLVILNHKYLEALLEFKEDPIYLERIDDVFLRALATCTPKYVTSKNNRKDKNNNPEWLRKISSELIYSKESLQQFAKCFKLQQDKSIIRYVSIPQGLLISNLNYETSILLRHITEYDPEGFKDYKVGIVQILVRDQENLKNKSKIGYFKNILKSIYFIYEYLNEKLLGRIKEICLKYIFYDCYVIECGLILNRMKYSGRFNRIAKSPVSTASESNNDYIDLVEVSLGHKLNPDLGFRTPHSRRALICYLSYNPTDFSNYKTEIQKHISVTEDFSVLRDLLELLLKNVNLYDSYFQFVSHSQFLLFELFNLEMPEINDLLYELIYTATVNKAILVDMSLKYLIKGILMSEVKIDLLVFKFYKVLIQKIGIIISTTIEFIGNRSLNNQNKGLDDHRNKGLDDHRNILVEIFNYLVENTERNLFISHMNSQLAFTNKVQTIYILNTLMAIDFPFDYKPILESLKSLTSYIIVTDDCNDIENLRNILFLNFIKEFRLFLKVKKARNCKFIFEDGDLISKTEYNSDEIVRIMDMKNLIDECIAGY